MSTMQMVVEGGVGGGGVAMDGGDAMVGTKCGGKIRAPKLGNGKRHHHPVLFYFICHKCRPSRHVLKIINECSKS